MRFIPLKVFMRRKAIIPLAAVALAGVLACGGLGGQTPSEALPTSAWSDCEAVCMKIRDSCGQGEQLGPEPMACHMHCDLAAQWEGQPMPDSDTEAIRQSMLCVAEAATCAQVSGCLSE